MRLAGLVQARHRYRMKTLGLIVVAIAFGSSGAIAAPAPHGCDLSNVKYLGEIQSILSRRAVEVVSRATHPRDGDDVRLQQLVAPDADFSLGAGDVGRPLGKGVSGVRTLAAEMRADTFRYLDWNYIPTRTETPCAPQKVNVEFTDTQRKYVYPVTFTFRNGQVVSAEGWSRTFESGPLEPVGK